MARQQPSCSITKRCYARIGLLGNPSDGYGGCCISLSLANFWAEVTLTPRTEGVQFQHHPVHDVERWASIADLSAHVQQFGYGSGVQLLKAMCSVLEKHCKGHSIPLHTDRGGFVMSYDTNIPRQAGLAGSSAICTAALWCLMEWFSLKDDAIPLCLQPNLVLAAETELGITAGLQDRVVQVYGGLVYMDFSQLDSHGCGQYCPLDLQLLPPLYLIWSGSGSPSGKVHSGVRQRWLAGDPQVVSTMQELAKAAQSGRRALEASDVQQLARLMDENFRLRCKVFGTEVVGQTNIDMVQVATSVGAAAKLTGSGGAVVTLCPEGVHQEQALQDACRKAGLHVALVKVARGQYAAYT